MRKIKERKPKNHYYVYIRGIGSGCYAEDYCREFVGETWAVSEKQACNNVRFQTRDDKRPNGGYSIFGIGDRLEEGDVLFTYEAELVGD